jgi:hypothetical protein
LLDRVDDRLRPIQVRYAPHRLIVRGMCGAPPEQWTSESVGPALAVGQNSSTRSHFVYSSGGPAKSGRAFTRS